MKLTLRVLLYFIILTGLGYQPGCSTADSCTFEITGTWNFTVIWDWDVAEDWPWNQTFTFSGSSTSGVVGGVSFFKGNAGTYTVSDCTIVQVIWDYIDMEGVYECHIVCTVDGTSTSGTSMNGTITINYGDFPGICYGVETGTWTATKI